MERRYGFFRCTNCRKTWESSHVYCDESGTPLYQQECKGCKKGCLPYRVEKIRCADCQQKDCTCTREDKKSRHIDPNKPHRADLCLKCRSGNPCKQ